jgi:hypothetical protein
MLSFVKNEIGDSSANLLHSVHRTGENKDYAKGFGTKFWFEPIGRTVFAAMKGVFPYSFEHTIASGNGTQCNG